MIRSINLHSYYLIYLTLFLLISCEPEKKKVERIIRPVRYQQVFSTGGVRTRSFSGIAKSRLESKLSFKVEGTITKLSVKVGDKLEKGQLLARLDPQDYVVKVKETEASLTRARSEERNEAANYERVRQLYENRNASLSELDAARAAAESAKAMISSTQKQLDYANLQLSYTKLNAPVSGAIAAVNVETNENIKPGQTIAILTSGSEIEVEVAIPESLIHQIKKGEVATVTFDAFPGKKYPAVITEVGVATVGASTTYPLTVRLKQQIPNVLPGMSAEVALLFGTGEKKERLLVPPVAVGEDREGRFVFIVEPVAEPGFGIVHRRAVTVGELTEEGLEILKGLSDGDRVIIAGVSKMTEGLNVKIPKIKQ